MSIMINNSLSFISDEQRLIIVLIMIKLNILSEIARNLNNRKKK